MANQILNRVKGISLLALWCFVSCTSTGPSGLFGKKSAHDQYGDKLNEAGLQQTALGKQWFTAAESSLSSPLEISIPYREAGYFAADEPRAAGLIFEGQRGEKLHIELTKKPLQNFTIFVDLLKAPAAIGDKPTLLLSLDSTKPATYEVEETGKLLIRLQPELLASGEYTLSVSSGPSLAFPVTPKVSSNIGSFWGAGRDGGARKHEGIDIFAPRNTALLAAADGVITRVNENNLGGKVVFMRPKNKNFTLYYAHLNKQLVQPGQVVAAGDTIGLVGNSGNASTTPPHLHFGIYTSNGAVDPLPFVKQEVKKPAEVTAATINIGSLVRCQVATDLLAQPQRQARVQSAIKKNTLLKIEAATANFYKVLLPDGNKGFIAGNNVDALSVPIKKATLSTDKPLLNQPFDTGATITRLPAGEKVNVLAVYNNFYFVSKAADVKGWISSTGM